MGGQNVTCYIDGEMYEVLSSIKKLTGRPWKSVMTQALKFAIKKGFLDNYTITIDDEIKRLEEAKAILSNLRASDSEAQPDSTPPPDPPSTSPPAREEGEPEPEKGT